MEGEAGMKLVSLFGNNMSTMLPTAVIDVSELREIPDNQEVFTHAHTDQSLIIEILEYVQETDQQALKSHFEDLASSNDASDGDNSKIVSVEQIPAETLSFPECEAAYFITGEQLISKFKESARNNVAINLAVFRLPKFETDILVTFNDPVNISPQSSSHGPVPVAAQPWTLQHFRQAVLSLRLHNTDFLG